VGETILQQQRSLPEGDLAAEDKWWADFESYGNLINSTANAGDPRYDQTRMTMATLGAKEDKQAGIAWADSITKNKLRADAAANVALAAHGIEGMHLSDGGFFMAAMKTSTNAIPYMQQGRPMKLKRNAPTADLVQEFESIIQESNLKTRSPDIYQSWAKDDEGLLNTISERRSF
jgi:hypothetical protein